MSLQELVALPLQNRLHAMQVLWDSFDSQGESDQVFPGWHEVEVAQRLSQQAQNPMQNLSLSDAKRIIAQRTAH